MPAAIRSVCLFALTLALAIPALAQSPWSGTWKLNQAKSKLTGDTYTVTSVGDKYHYDGGSLQYDFACDGKDYPTIGGETVSCHETSTTRDTVVKQNGKAVATIHRQIDPDGHSYTGTRTDMLASGGTTVSKTVFTRVGQGGGFSGTWKSASTSSNRVEPFILKVNGDSMHMEVPEERLTWDGKLDGTPAAVHGPDIPEGLTVSEKAEGPNKLVSDIALGGKHLQHAEDTLSADGKSFSEISWDPAKPNEKQTSVFEKQ